MRAALGLLVLLGLTALLVATAAPAPVHRPFPVAASAPAATIEMVSDRDLVGRKEGLNLTVWLNVTGNGQFQQTWMNVTFNTATDPSQNSLTQGSGSGPMPPTQPGACALVYPSGWFMAWECVGLRAGTYVWVIPAYVPDSATVAHSQRVNASMYSTLGGGNVSANTSVTVWIAGAVLRIVDVDSVPRDFVRPGEIVQYWVNVSNDATAGTTAEVRNGTAYNVTLTLRLDPGLSPGAGLPSLTMTFENLTPNSVLSVNFETIASQNLAAGTNLGIRVLLSYHDSNGQPIGPIEGQSPPLYVNQANLLSTANIVAGAAIGLAAILTTLVVLLYAGQRKIVIDEVFLMTKGGILIRHLSREPELKKDDDIVASMFVAIQEFVRDSFRREASLDSVAFGRRRAAVVRGELTILAGVISHGDAEAVTPELVAAVRQIESRYWDVLVRWDGSFAGLRGVEDVLAELMQGKFRSAWRVQIA